MAPRLGPMPGSDRKHDIWGQKDHHVEFIAHCTTEKKGLQGKILSDVTGGVRECLRLARPKGEIIFFSAQEFIRDPLKQSDFLSTLMVKITTIDPRYRSRHPAIQLLSGSTLAVEIASAPTGMAYQHLSALLGQPPDPELDIVFEEDMVGEFQCTEAEFRRLLSSYQDRLPDGMRIEILAQLLKFSWNSIVFNPVFAAALDSRGIAIYDTAFGPLLNLLRSISLQQAPDDAHVNAAMNLLRELAKLFPDLKSEADRFRLRLTRALLYRCPEVFESDEGIEHLQHIAETPTEQSEEFIIDLFLRSVCDHILLGARARTLIEISATNGFAGRLDHPLTLVSPFILHPLAKHAECRYAETVSSLRHVATKCVSAIEAKWVIAALKRVGPLYANFDSEEDEDQDSALVEMLQSFSSQLTATSRGLRFIALQQLLHSFLRKRKIADLLTFEEQFAGGRRSLLPPQISHLQLEYVCSLYLALQSSSGDEFEQLVFARLLRDGVNPAEHILLSNQALSFKITRLPLSCADRSSVFRWLLQHAVSLFRVYGEERICRNHLGALQFHAVSRIPQLRSQVAAAVLTSLNRTAATHELHSNSFCAKTCLVFKYLPRSRHTELMLNYIRKALAADKYSVVRSARDIAHALYFCFFYGSAQFRSEVRDLTCRLGEVTDLPKGVPRMHWAYYACIMFTKLSVEKEFLEALQRVLPRAPLLDKGSTGSDRLYEMHFTNEVLETIRQYVGRSLFSAVLDQQITNPEVWNTMGTTCMLHRSSDEDKDSLLMAATFYSFARCFVREQRDLGLKYAYNYIKACCMAIGAQAVRMDETFATNVAMYLSSTEAEFFAYKTECTKPYFDLLAINLKAYLPETRHLVMTELSKRKWTQQELKVRRIV